jgi:hypothetical protein
MLMAVLAMLLLLSMQINAFRFGAQWSDLLAICRLFYFSAIVVFCVAFVRRFGPAALVFPFTIGIAWLAGERLYSAVMTGAKIVFGLPLLKDPNVVGNMFGIGTFMCSILILRGWTKWPLILMTGFAIMSLMTFSKGAWLLVLLGIAANLTAVVMRNPLTARGVRNTLAALGAIVITLGALAYMDSERMTRLISFKLQSSDELSTVNFRYRFALAGAYAMGDHPLFGIGFRNYSIVEDLYPGVLPEPSENAHNVFAQVGAIGGAPALVVFLVLFLYPFVQLWKVVKRRYAVVGGIIYVALAAAVFFTSGAVQLQLMAQPFFWVFTGVVRGWTCLEAERAARAGMGGASAG